MTSLLETQLREDRALRDAARELFLTELAHARREATPDAIGQRIATTVGARVDKMSDATIEFADRHGNTVIAALAAAASAAGLWLARKPILSGLARLKSRRDEKTRGSGASDSDKDTDHE